MPTSVAAPGPVPYGQRLRLGTSLGEYSFRCTCKRMLFHSIEGLRKVMFPMVELVNERKNLIRKHVDRLRSVDALILGSSDAVSSGKHPCDDSAEPRTPFPRKQKRHEPL
jgi:hypothetical protein